MKMTIAEIQREIHRREGLSDDWNYAASVEYDGNWSEIEGLNEHGDAELLRDGVRTQLRGYQDSLPVEFWMYPRPQGV